MWWGKAPSWFDNEMCQWVRCYNCGAKTPTTARIIVGARVRFLSVHISFHILDLERWFPNMTRRSETSINQSVRLRSFDTIARDCKDKQEMRTLRLIRTLGNFTLYPQVYTLLVLIELIRRRRQKTNSFKWREFLNMVLKWYHTKLSIWRAPGGRFYWACI